MVLLATGRLVTALSKLVSKTCVVKGPPAGGTSQMIGLMSVATGATILLMTTSSKAVQEFPPALVSVQRNVTAGLPGAGKLRTVVRGSVGSSKVTALALVQRPVAPNGGGSCAFN